VLAWPAVVVILVIWLREPLKERISNVESAKVPGAEFHFAERAAQVVLEEDLTEAADSLALTDPVGAEQGSGEPTGEQPSTTVEEEEPVVNRRDVIEQLVRSAAAWGVTRGASGLGVTGMRIDWEGDIPRLRTPAARLYTSKRQMDFDRQLLRNLQEEAAERAGYDARRPGHDAPG